MKCDFLRFNVAEQCCKLLFGANKAEAAIDFGKRQRPIDWPQELEANNDGHDCPYSLEYDKIALAGKSNNSVVNLHMLKYS